MLFPGHVIWLEMIIKIYLQLNFGLKLKLSWHKFPALKIKKKSWIILFMKGITKQITKVLYPFLVWTIIFLWLYFCQKFYIFWTAKCMCEWWNTFFWTHHQIWTYGDRLVIHRKLELRIFWKWQFCGIDGIMS